MVLIHGSWADHETWARVTGGLSERFRLLTYDRRGHSGSEKVGGRGSGDEDAADVEALMARLDLVPAHVVGNSYGAIVALKLAARNPSVFRSLMVHEPPTWDLPVDDASMLPALAAVRRSVDAVAGVLESGDREGGARMFVERLMIGPGGWERMPPRLKATFVANADTFLDEARDPMGLNLDLRALARFRKPALLSYGGRSPPYFRPVIETLARAISGSRVDLYPADGHTPHVSNPGEFLRRVTAFAEAADI